MRFSIDELAQLVTASRHLSSFQGKAKNPVTPHRIRHGASVSEWIGCNEAMLPAWTDTLNICLAKAASLPEAEDQSILMPGFPRPFEEVLLPFVATARGALQRFNAQHYHSLSESAHRALERSLLFWLAELNALPMQLEFAAFREARLPGLFRAMLPDTLRPNDACYGRFVKGLREGGLKAYLQEYPVLARLLVTSLHQWVESVTELILRLKQDETAIAGHFNNGLSSGAVIEIQPNCSDRHHDGRSVMILKFQSGLRLVYKPRDIGLDQAFSELVIWLNEAGAPHTFKSFKVLPGEGYGWAEFVPAMPIPDRAGAQAYYHRAGSLLCLVHVLGATDLHFENIIGHGSYPTLIDVETLLHPLARQAAEKSDDARSAAGRLLYESVIRTGMLPRWYTDETDQAYDVSTLGAGIPQDLSLDWVRWKSVNTDDMTAKKEKLRMFPSRDGAEAPEYGSGEYRSELVAGFCDTYRFLMQHRYEVVNSAAWKNLSGQSIRFVFRPTKVYSRVLKHLLQPKLLKSAEDRYRYLDRLHGDPETRSKHFPWSQLISLEQAALDWMDVPHFTTRTNTTSLFAGLDCEVRGYFGDTAYSRACIRLQSLNEQDLKRQISFITGSMHCRCQVRSHSDIGASGKVDTRRPVLDPSKALEEAGKIANILLAGAIRGTDGSVAWIAPRLIPASGRYQLDPIADDLYAGNAGIALFFAALYRLTGASKYHTLTKDTLRSLMQSLEAGRVQPCALKTPGGFSGWGGVAYSLLQAHILTGESAFSTAAMQAAACITPEMLDTDTALDLMNGASGAILSLAAVYMYREESMLLEIMIRAGEHLMQRRGPTAQGFRSWRTGGGAFLTGFSHGAAGIAYSLLRLSKITGRKDFRDAALEAIAWEDSVFDHSEHNWPDLRTMQSPGESPGCMRSWCHGAAGVGLSRLEALRAIPSADLERDLSYALTATRSSLNGATDYVCCGNLGRIELLVTASQHLGETALLREAQAAAGAIVRNAAGTGGYRYHPAIGYTPAFFQGLSGIGYQLLRCTHPNILPCVLTLS